MNKVKFWLVAIFLVGAIENGGLMAYGQSRSTVSPHCGNVDKILKGKTRRSAGRAADEVRVCHQPESREADRPDDSAERAGESG